MTGPEHYKEAETLLGRSRYFFECGETSLSASLSAEAQVHATLALAAATAIPSARRGIGSAYDSEWRAVLS